MLKEKAIKEKTKHRNITLERQTNEVDQLRSTIEEIRERLDHQDQMIEELLNTQRKSAKLIEKIFEKIKE